LLWLIVDEAFLNSSTPEVIGNFSLTVNSYYGKEFWKTGYINLFSLNVQGKMFLSAKKEAFAWIQFS